MAESSAALKPAKQIAESLKPIFPNEPPAYREARNRLLAEEIELRRNLERVAQMRRELPDGGEPGKDYVFRSPDGEVRLSHLFGNKPSLVLYSMMFGPERKRPCPMCTSLVSALNGAARNLNQRVALYVIARSPIERILTFAEERGWKDIHFLSDPSGDYTRAYVSPDDGDMPALNVFTRRHDTIRHFWAGETFRVEPDPGQDPRGAPELDALWLVQDLTPEGRDPKWYPSLEYRDR